MALRCHYVVLGVENTATDDELKKAYRKQALLWHPDRNLDSREEAEARFKELQGAHAVLTDPHERSWYDQHRDAILRGGSGVAGDAAADGSESADPASHLWFYFTAAAYSGYLTRLDYQCSLTTYATTNATRTNAHSLTHSLTHVRLTMYCSRYEDGQKSFYTVYAQLFAALDSEECAATPGRAAGPGFGSSAEPWAEVREFYATWETFATCRSCAQYDKHDLRRAEDRKVRRLVEKEES